MAANTCVRNLLHNPAYNPGVVTWVDESTGCFKVTSTTEFAKTWGKMKSNRCEEEAKIRVLLSYLNYTPLLSPSGIGT
jgi:hypothetical protein